MVALSDASITLHTSYTRPTLALASLTVAVVACRAIQIAVTRLTCAVRISQWIAEIASATLITKLTSVTGLTYATNLALPDITAFSEITASLRTRTRLTAVWRIRITIIAISTLFTVATACVVTTIL